MICQLVIEDKLTGDQKDIRFFDKISKARRHAYDSLEEGDDWELRWDWVEDQNLWIANSNKHKFKLLIIEVES